jgi:hypothetical protein
MSDIPDIELSLVREILGKQIKLDKMKNQYGDSASVTNSVKTRKTKIASVFPDYFNIRSHEKQYLHSRNERHN